MKIRFICDKQIKKISKSLWISKITVGLSEYLILLGNATVTLNLLEPSEELVPPMKEPGQLACMCS
jgi:hypothetical protein